MDSETRGRHYEENDFSSMKFPIPVYEYKMILKDKECNDVHTIYFLNKQFLVIQKPITQIQIRFGPFKVLNP
jgi:hypothetical protein